MRATRIVQKILANYEGETPGVKANLCRMLMAGKLGGTGKMIILPVDQGFEHGPARSFAPNPAGYDPHYHYQLAIDAGLNGLDALLSTVQMPQGIPVATVAVNGAGNAAILAAEMLALGDESIRLQLDAMRADMAKKVLGKDAEVQKRIADMMEE